MDRNRVWLTVVKSLLLLAALVGAIWFLKSISWVISLLIISLLIVYTLYPLLTFLKTKWRLPHLGAVIVVFLFFLLLCVLSICLLIPVIHTELTEIMLNLPLYMLKVQNYIDWLTAQILHFEMQNEIRSFIMNLPQEFSQLMEYVFEGTKVVVFALVYLFFIMFLVFYLLYDFHSIRKQLIYLVPKVHRPVALRIISLVDNNVGGFIRGSLLRCLIVGVVTGLVLYLIGMPHALLLGIIAGLFNFILYIGPYIAAIPALLLSFSSITPAPWVVLLVYVAIQLADGTLLAPFLLGKTVKLKPITIIVSILVGGTVGGLLGMVVAVPLAGIVKGLLEIMKERAAYQ